MSRADFIVAFHGDAVEGGRMDVRDLAPALMSLGRAIDAANLVVNGERQPARIEVVALSVGSFEVHLDHVLSGWEQIKSFLKDADVDAAKQLLEWIGILVPAGAIAGASVISLYRFLGGRKPDAVERSPQGFIFRLDGRAMLVPLEVLRLYRETSFNNALVELLETLERPGIERVEFKREGATTPDVILTNADRVPFALPRPPDTRLVDDTRTLALSIGSLAFQEGSKWRLFDGQNVITATIEDREFLAKIDASLVRFAKGDMLICGVRTVQTQGVDGLRTEHNVLRVREHLAAATQIPLDI